MNIRVEAGERVAIHGPCGAGKSVLLCLGAGLLLPERGRVLVGDRPLEMIALEAMLADVEKRIGIETQRFHLFGYSGGAQFAHRFVMTQPHRVRSLAVAAAGWYTFPDVSRPFPHGIGSTRRPKVVHIDIHEFLRVPVRAYVGVLDTRRDAALRRSSRVEVVQGANRVERAVRWIDALDRQARARGIKARARVELLSGLGHSFRDCVHAGGLVSRVYEFLTRPSRNQAGRRALEALRRSHAG